MIILPFLLLAFTMIIPPFLILAIIPPSPLLVIALIISRFSLLARSDHSANATRGSHPAWTKHQTAGAASHRDTMTLTRFNSCLI